MLSTDELTECQLILRAEKEARKKATIEQLCFINQAVRPAAIQMNISQAENKILRLLKAHL